VWLGAPTPLRRPAMGERERSHSLTLSPDSGDVQLLCFSHLRSVFFLQIRLCFCTNFFKKNEHYNEIIEKSFIFNL
jgi:hypothetical protein